MNDKILTKKGNSTNKNKNENGKKRDKKRSRVPDRSRSKTKTDHREYKISIILRHSSRRRKGKGSSSSSISSRTEKYSSESNSTVRDNGKKQDRLFGKNDKDKDKIRSDSSKEKEYESNRENQSQSDMKIKKSSNFSAMPCESQQPVEIVSIPIPANSQSLQPLALAQAAKVDRKLYIGNLPTGITPSSLVKLLNAALFALNANIQQGDPVLSAWISTDGHYAFVEFRTAEEANNGFLLNNISILGQPLKVGRPKTYTGVLSMIEEGGLCNTVAAALQAGTMNVPLVGTKVQFPTKVLCFKGITKGINIDDDEEYSSLAEDIKEECSKHGRVTTIFLPRKDVEDNASPGMGNAYVEFMTTEEAREARKQLCGRKFNQITVNMVYFSEEKYNARDFSLNENQIKESSN